MTRRARFYNLLLTNTPIYAGEFRFVTEDSADDGLLDLHLFSGAANYLRRYPSAWLRHLRHERGFRFDVPEPPVERVRDLVIETDVPMGAQLDGEQLEAAARFVVRVLPAELAVKVPPSANR
jgi:diacylglycerol kinase family enzyme